MYVPRRLVDHLYTAPFLKVHFVFPKELTSEFALPIDGGGAYDTENQGGRPKWHPYDCSIANCPDRQGFKSGNRKPACKRPDLIDLVAKLLDHKANAIIGGAWIDRRRRFEFASVECRSNRKNIEVEGRSIARVKTRHHFGTKLC